MDPASLSSNIVAALYEDSAGTLWVGTAFGLDRLDRTTGKFAHYRNQADDPSTLSNNYVIAIYPDRSGALWLATLIGLNKFAPGTGKVTRYLNTPSDANSLSGNFVLGVYPDRSVNVWIGTYTDGLNRLDPAIDKRYYPQKDYHSLLRGDTRDLQVGIVLQIEQSNIEQRFLKSESKFEPR